MSYRGRSAFSSHRSSARHIGFGLGGEAKRVEWVQAVRNGEGLRETAATLDRVQPENVSIYLSTRSRRINGSAAGNFSRYVCRPDSLRILACSSAPFACPAAMDVWNTVDRDYSRNV